MSTDSRPWLLPVVALRLVGLHGKFVSDGRSAGYQVYESRNFPAPPHLPAQPLVAQSEAAIALRVWCDFGIECPASNFEIFLSHQSFCLHLRYERFADVGERRSPRLRMSKMRRGVLQTSFGADRGMESTERLVRQKNVSAMTVRESIRTLASFPFSNPPSFNLLPSLWRVASSWWQRHLPSRCDSARWWREFPRTRVRGYSLSSRCDW
ncbi:hypothetical protein Rcae01_05574 [Novipirellula caenicola]|uniref:Uncharacterized protein n=1 Tax=Novipirellula caenicola TaxID=1536901 RepID=A0ABP9W2D4_9BACT